MEVDDKGEVFNPWKVEDIDQFLNYCCPECDTKQKTKSDFIIHAIDSHPDSREYLPLFDYEKNCDDALSDIEIKEDFVNESNLSDFETFDPLKTEISVSNGSPSVKIEALSMNILMNMECNEEDCGRYFVTQESLLDHKKHFHQKLKRRLSETKKLELDYEEGIESSKDLETNVECDTIAYIVSDDFHQDDNSNFEEERDDIPDENKEKVEEQPKVPKKRKLIDDSEGEPKKGKACRYIQNMSDNYKGKYLIDIDPSDGIQKFKCDECGMFFKSHRGILYHKRKFHGEPEGPKKGKTPTYTRDIDPTDGIQKIKCDECGMFFKSNVGILYHKRNFHSNDQDQELQKCCLCDDIFPPNILFPPVSCL